MSSIDVVLDEVDQATIEVEDDGPGISNARKKNVLEPFVRGDDARNMDDASGFGLGLSIANAIITAHGGTLSLHDRQPHRPQLHPDATLRRSRSPRSDNRRRGRTTGKTYGPDCFQPNRVSQLACRIVRRDFREANSRNQVEPWRISLQIVL
jgi:signal transduction histidine kinase